MDHFKEIWYNEYLLSLRDSYKDLHDDKFENQVKVGDIVLLKNMQPDVVKKRQHWSLARVLELMYSSDWKVRPIKLLKRTADYITRPRLPELHPIKHLYPLELNVTHQHQVDAPRDNEYEELASQDIEPDLDFSASLDEDEQRQLESNDIVSDSEPSFAAAAQTSYNAAPFSKETEPLHVEPIRYSSRGRRLIPRTGYENCLLY